MKAPKLAACKKTKSASVNAFCGSLRAAYVKLDTAALTVDADATSIEQTVSRETAAGKEGDQTAVNTQDADLKKLLTDTRKAEQAETSTGAKVAKVLKSKHIAFKLSAKQAAKLDKTLSAKLAAKGLTAAEVKGIDPSAFTAKKTNLLTVL